MTGRAWKCPKNFVVNQIGMERRVFVVLTKEGRGEVAPIQGSCTGTTGGRMGYVLYQIELIIVHNIGLKRLVYSIIMHNARLKLVLFPFERKDGDRRAVA